MTADDLRQAGREAGTDDLRVVLLNIAREHSEISHVQYLPDQTELVPPRPAFSDQPWRQPAKDVSKSA